MNIRITICVFVLFSMVSAITQLEEDLPKVYEVLECIRKNGGSSKEDICANTTGSSCANGFYALHLCLLNN